MSSAVSARSRSPPTSSFRSKRRGCHEPRLKVGDGAVRLGWLGSAGRARSRADRPNRRRPAQVPDSRSSALEGPCARKPAKGTRHAKPARGVGRLDDIPHDLSFAYTLKAVFEDILGPEASRKLKECDELRIWKSESGRLLRASLIAFRETVEISDDAFREEMEDTINFGIQTVRSAKSINQLFSSLAATYARLSFLQLGFGPSRWRSSGSLRKQDWKLSGYRTVQYVQTERQKRNLETIEKRRKSRDHALVKDE
jgi:hypothetical protein